LANIFQYFLCTHCHHFPLAGVTDTQTSILRSGAKQAAISVPADAVDEVWMVVHGDEGFTCPHIPDDYQVITAWKVIGSEIKDFCNPVDVCLDKDK